MRAHQRFVTTSEEPVGGTVKNTSADSRLSWEFAQWTATRFVYPVAEAQPLRDLRDRSLRVAGRTSCAVRIIWPMDSPTSRTNKTADTR